MALKDGFNNFANELAEKAIKCLSSKYTDNDKAGIVLSMVLDGKDAVEGYLGVIDKLNETNQQLLAQNRELMSKLESIQKSQSLSSKCFNGICNRIDHIDNQLKFISSKKNN